MLCECYAEGGTSVNAVRVLSNATGEGEGCTPAKSVAAAKYV
jgi:hypothetical protein